MRLNKILTVGAIALAVSAVSFAGGLTITDNTTDANTINVTCTPDPTGAAVNVSKGSPVNKSWKLISVLAAGFHVPFVYGVTTSCTFTNSADGVKIGSADVVANSKDSGTISNVQKFNGYDAQISADTGADINVTISGGETK
jgi:hypothetical protein